MNGRDTRGSIDTLIRGEISAVETYVQAMNRMPEDEAAHRELKSLMLEHVAATNALRDWSRAVAGDPPTDSGAWGAWAKTVEGTAKLFGRRAALVALREGEEHAIHEYESALRDPDLPDAFRSLVLDELIPRGQDHVRRLQELMLAQ